MGEKNYKVNEPIEIGYQAPNAESGLTGVVAEIFLPTKVKDPVNFADVVLVEVADTGTYRGQFTPNAEGVWQVILHKADGSGKVTKSFSVGSHNIHTIGQLVSSIDSNVNVVSNTVNDINNKVDALSVAISTQATPPMAF